jgi:Zn-dependent protease
MNMQKIVIMEPAIHHTHSSKTRKFGKFTMSDRELADLIKAWLAISVAFAIVLGGFSISIGFLLKLLAAGFTVGVGFLLHEMGHKIVAQRYGLRAEFVSFDIMLVLAIAMSFFGFVFAAPGAVMIFDRVKKDEYGKISVMGPIMNLAIALLFLAVYYIQNSQIIDAVAMYGFVVNSWLAVFNMIPIWQLDGLKIYRWNKPVYFTVLAIAISFMILQYAIGRSL